MAVQVVSMQAPSTQRGFMPPIGQATLQPPQFMTLCLRSTQVPLHSMRPVRQWHAEPEQVWLKAQAVPHALQDWAVFSVVVQMSFAVQLSALHWQAPPWQIAPWRQALLHAPQLSGSVSVAAQTPLQMARQVQVPPTHF